MIINHNLTQSPDQVSVVDSRNGSASALNPTRNINGDWYMDKSSNNLYYMGKATVVQKVSFDMYVLI